MDGLTILKRWRKAGRTTAVLILTVRGTWNERVDGRDAGADDHLAKPLHVEEVLARLRAIIRRSGGNAGSVIKIGETELDEHQLRVTVRDGTVNLSPQEDRLVADPMMHSGRVVPYQKLAEQL